MNRVDTALNAARETRALRIGKGTLSETPHFFKQLFPDHKAIIVTDHNLWEPYGKSIAQAFYDAKIATESPFVFPERKPYADMEHVDQLTNALLENKAIPVVVGSGSLNDLTKLASFRSDRPYICVGTAASMDGYTAFGASITHEGSKQTFNCPAPAGVLVDTSIIAEAPSAMTASGYADLLAKITAGADWIISDALEVEKIDETAFHIVQDGLETALGDPMGVKESRIEAMEPLIEGLILGGFAMQWSKSSRPASGAEHQFSHLWDMEHHQVNGVAPSHGFKVAVGVQAVTALYEKLLASNIEQMDIEECCRQWPTLEEMNRRTSSLLEGSDILYVGLQETQAKYITKEELLHQLTLLKNNWPELRARLHKQLLPLEEIQRRFALVGAPTSSEQIGISTERLRESFLKAQLIRRRFTILDLVLRIGKLEEWTKTLTL